MPSLRRTLSTPAVRSSPYPSSLSASSSSSSSQAAHRAQPNPHRRSSGSDIIGRRVLAEIEWWRVTEGQLDPEAEQSADNVDRDNDHDQVAGEVELVGSGPRPLSIDLDWFVPETPPLTPSTPVLPLPSISSSRSHSRHCSWSSLSSSGSIHEDLEDLRHDLNGLTLSVRSPSQSSETSKQVDSYPAHAFMHSHSLADCVLESSIESGLYADFAFSPLSAPAIGILN